MRTVFDIITYNARETPTKRVCLWCFGKLFLTQLVSCFFFIFVIIIKCLCLRTAENCLVSLCVWLAFLFILFVVVVCYRSNKHVADVVPNKRKILLQIADYQYQSYGILWLTNRQLNKFSTFFLWVFQTHFCWKYAQASKFLFHRVK